MRNTKQIFWLLMANSSEKISQTQYKLIHAFLVLDEQESKIRKLKADITVP